MSDWGFRALALNSKLSLLLKEHARFGAVSTFDVVGAFAYSILLPVLLLGRSLNPGLQ